MTALATSKTFTDVSPVTGEAVAELAAMSAADAVAAVERAALAAPGWAATSFVDRRRVLLRAADLLEEEVEEHVATFALEVGAVRAWAEMNVHEAAATLREAAGLTSSPLGSVLPSHEPASVTQSLRGPAGLSLSIVPWNAPLVLAARSSAISLAVGNAVVLRPSEHAPLTAGHLLAGALQRAGVPADLVPVVTTAPGQGRDAIAAMVEHPAVRRVVFIGSTAVGRAIAQRAGHALTPAVLELGGKNATVVTEDVDLDAWTPRLAFAAFANTGQVCMCTDRIVAHESVAEELVERLTAAAEAMVVGDPREPATDLGPLIDDRAADAYRAFVADAVQHGATVRTGGTADGRCARPTVLTGVGPACRFHAEEGFAPLVSVTAVASDDEAVAAANDGDLGLIASVVCGDEARALRIARRVRAGAVHVNGPSVGDEPHVPFGGLGASGAGRLGGEESVRFFTEQRTFYVHGSDVHGSGH